MPSSACDWSSDVCSSDRSEEHTSELQSRSDLVCRLLLEKKKTNESRSLLTIIAIDENNDALSAGERRYTDPEPPDGPLGHRGHAASCGRILSGLSIAIIA